MDVYFDIVTLELFVWKFLISCHKGLNIGHLMLNQNTKIFLEISLGKPLPLLAPTLTLTLALSVSLRFICVALGRVLVHSCDTPNM